MERLLQDLRFGLRALWKNPAFAVVVVLTLALGIGMNTAIFTVVNAALLRPLPYRDPDRLVHLWESRQQRADFSQMEASYPNFLDWVARSTAFEQLAGYGFRAFSAAGTEGPEQIIGAQVSAGFFDVLGVPAALGRTFRPGEDTPGSERVVLLTQELWRRRFGGDPSALGKTLNLNGVPFTVVGVLPASFHFAQLAGAQLWVPLGDLSPSQSSRRNLHWVRVIGRLKPGLTLSQASADMNTLAQALEAQYPEANAGARVGIFTLHEQILGSIQPILLLLLGAVGLVLLIACANVANLLLARSAVRQKEIAIRLAMGASRWRLVQQMLTESTLLAVLGGALGVLWGQWGLDLLLSAIPEPQLAAMPYLKDIGLDGGVLAFTFAVSLATGAICGLVSSVQSSHPDLQGSLRQDARSAGARRRGLRDALVVAEVAVAIVLLVGAGLLLRSMFRVLDVDPGFKPAGLITMTVTLPSGRYTEDAQAVGIHDRMLEQVLALPGVEGVATDSKLPLTGWGNTARFRVDGRPIPAQGMEDEANIRTVSPDYFHVMGIPLVKGRAFGPQDRLDSPAVVIINRTLAEQVFPGEDAVGQRLVLTYAPNLPAMEVVAVAGDVKLASLDAKTLPALSLPGGQNSVRRTSLIVRVSTDPHALASGIRRELRILDSELLIASVMTMEERAAASPALFMRRYPAMLVGLFAAVALALAMVGVYGVISYSVSQRTHEIGVRMAIGAQRGDIVGMVIRQGMGTALVGVALGLVGSAALSQLIQSLLFGVSPIDVATFAGVSLLLAGVALLACYVPARRATRIDPLIALK
jgi:putative ABC transport system permease protein